VVTYNQEKDNMMTFISSLDKDIAGVSLKDYAALLNRL